jgi:hypothetical protein
MTRSPGGIELRPTEVEFRTRGICGDYKLMTRSPAGIELRPTEVESSTPGV